MQQPSPYLTQAKQRFAALDYMLPQFVIGCSKAQMTTIAAQYPHPLPAALREALLWLGMTERYEDFYIGYFVGRRADLHDWARELFAENGLDPATFPKDAIIIQEHHGYALRFIRAAEGDNPPVYQYIEGDEIERVAPSFSAYLLNCVAHNEQYAHTLYQFGSPSEPQTMPNHQVHALRWDQKWENQIAPATLLKRVFAFPNLKSLTINGQGLKRLAPQIQQLRALQILNLAQNQLTQLPAEIGELAQLEMLTLSNNALTRLPAAIGRLTQLTHLDLDHNQIHTLKTINFGRLTQLKSLNLSHNQLDQLPDEIFQLPNLRKLSIDRNPLSKERVAHIKEQLPKCKVVFKYPVSKKTLLTTIAEPIIRHQLQPQRQAPRPETQGADAIKSAEGAKKTERVEEYDVPPQKPSIRLWFAIIAFITICLLCNLLLGLA